jgi:hypothetical protein
VCLDVDAASEADILVNFLYALDPGIHRRFKRSALIDIDPGLLQGWIATGSLDVADHDIYFTIGEHIGRRASRTWHHTPPPVALDAWPVVRAAQTASYTTVSHWWESSWVTWDGPAYLNDKRAGFMEYADLPRRTTVPLELALYLSPGDEEERRWLEQQGWRILLAQEVSASPARYRRYIQDSRGEFSCAKPSCVRLQNAWVSDRTLCYLASGKPAVVQHTGPSRFLPEADGLFRFRDIEDAARYFEVLERDYEKQCRSARALAEEYFDGRQVACAVLDLALS